MATTEVFTPEERAWIESVTPLRLECDEDGRLLAVVRPSRRGVKEVRHTSQRWMLVSIKISLRLARLEAQRVAAGA